MTPDTEPASPAAPPRKKPRISFLLATWFGLGYLPKAPGTWGSLAGVLIACVFLKIWPPQAGVPFDLVVGVTQLDAIFCTLIVLAALGVWTSRRTSEFLGIKDPQIVVIDEVSGQLITIMLGTLIVYQVPAGRSDIQIVQEAWAAFGFGAIPWKTLALAFLLFRLFDIWKPFPIRHLEKLPGGWGIMADDWLAGIYAAILLRVALHFNLL
jgi:phosphatidylglycerophosphatase A